MTMKKAVKIAIAAVLAFAPVVEAAHYSKFSIVTAAKQAGKWDALKAWIETAGYSDEWLAVEYLSDDYPQFAAITNEVVATGMASAEEIAAILSAARDTAPDALIEKFYESEMRTEPGRIRWHGKIKSKVNDPTNMKIIYTHEDGYVFEATKRSPEASVKAANDKLKVPVTTRGVPAKLAAARLKQQANKEPVEVNVTYEAGGEIKK